MARPLRVAFEGAVYHVMFRGNERRLLFRDDDDRRRFRRDLADSVARYRVALHLVCLMPNHVHLLLGTPAGNLSAFVGRLLTSYAVYFNRRHRRSGHLTSGRFKAQVVQGDAYLLKLSRYIHLNPVCGKRWQKVSMGERLQHLLAYRWSTFRGYTAEEPPWPEIQMAPILALVAPEATDPGAAYRRFVEEGLRNPDASFAAEYRSSELGVGSEPFREQVRTRHALAVAERRKPEDISFRRRVRRHSPSAILLVVARALGTEVGELRRRRRNSVGRGVAGWALQQFGGLTQREVAEELGVRTGAAISRQTARWRKRIDSEPAARELAGRIERELPAKAS